MADEDAVRVRPVDLTRAANLFVIELPKGASIPSMGSAIGHDGNTFVVVGILHFGREDRPVLLGEVRPTSE